MNKVKFFSGPDVAALEDVVNGWLEENKDIRIVHTNLDSVAKPEATGNKQGGRMHVFSILYTKAKATKRRKHVAETVAIPEGLTSDVIPAEQSAALPLASEKRKVDL